MKKKKFVKRKLKFFELILKRKLNKAEKLRQEMIQAILDRRKKGKDVNGLDF